MVLTDSQAELLLQQAVQVENWRDEDDLKRRNRVADEMQRTVRQAGILDGKVLDGRTLCELISLQWQVQNLNPMALPQFLGLYSYKVHFSGFEGTREDLLAERLSETGDPGMHEGADLAAISSALRLIASDKVDEQALGAAQLFDQVGAGQALVSGFLHLLHPTDFGLVNSPTKEPFQKSGWLGVSGEQRKQANAISKEKYDKSGVFRPHVHRNLLRWEVLIDEVKSICGFNTFHEVDQFLWSVSAGVSANETDERIQAAVDAISEDNLTVRRTEEQKARQLLDRHAGNLTSEQLSALLTHINACSGKKGVTYTRFSPAFVGHNANQLIERVVELNVWISKLWNADESEIPGLLTRFWEEKFSGGGRSFPSAILYLRDPKTYAVWTSNLENALYSVIPGLPSKLRTGFSYLQYCKGVQQLRKRFRFDSPMHDFVLFHVGKTPKAKTGTISSEFTGFNSDTFAFMADLLENNSKTWFDENRQRFKSAVDRPLRILVSELGKEVISSLDPRLETAAKSGKCISRIRKNIYGKKEHDIYQELFWAAYYRRELTKNTDCQLFISIRAGLLQHGIFFGEQADSVRAHFNSMLEAHPAIGEAVFARLRAGGFLFATAESSSGAPEPVDIPDFDAFAQLAIQHRFHVYRRLTAKEAVLCGPAIKSQIGDDFRTLHPLFKLATLSEPDDDLRRLVEDGDDEADDDVITVADLAADTFLEESFFLTLENYLADKQQLIFDGPPGTGKTFVARKLADYLCQGGGETRTIQFHPSYAYEDFIEGLRPTTSSSGALSYNVEDGIFKRLCDRARTNPEYKYVLVIDEINRGNIPRIFGELMFLLEHRGETTDLPYSKTPFSIPPNVIILGTMNTTDRSIALFDLALRRRFHFVTMEPRSDVLLSWLDQNNKPRLIRDVFDRLNERLAKAGIDSGRLVGHSHFMSTQIDEEFLSLVWDGTILPLVTEYFFAEPEKVTQFQLEEFLASAEADSIDDPDGDDDQDTEQEGSE